MQATAASHRASHATTRTVASSTGWSASCLPVISRRRRGVSLLTGGTDHTTHRLLAFLRTPRAVAAVMAAAQACLAGLAIEASRLGEPGLAVIACSAFAIAAGAVAIAESPGWMPVSHDS